jgi:hypothetical protein
VWQKGVISIKYHMPMPWQFNVYGCYKAPVSRYT